MTVRILHYSDVENAHDTPERAGRLAGAIGELRDDSTVVTGSGDNTAPGVLSLACDGAQAQDFYDAVDPDVDTFGNHDFDHGFDAARRAAREFPGAWLNANAYLDGERFAAEHTTPSVLVDAGGETVGFVGVANEATPEMNPKADALDVRDPATAVNDAASDLRDAGADHVVVVSHCGDRDDELATEVDADAILGGHEHDEHLARVDSTLVARPGACGHGLLAVRLGDEVTATQHDTADFPVDESVADALRERKDRTGLSAVVATVEEPVTRTERDRKGGESPVGNFVTDAMRAAGAADAAFVFGGIREDDPLEGEVTAGEIHGLCPFDDEVAVAEVDGATLLDALRDLSFAARHPDEDVPAWWFGQVSGIELVYDDRDHAVVEASVGGDPIHPDDTYEVALSDYHVETDHIVRAVGPDDVVRTAVPLRDALVAYAREAGVNTDVEGRIQRPYLETPTLH
ncbi:bifunctional metallophosphatase/5'-nucleotidase [Halobacterium litoreum]|uniref:Bifunctional metallophosphatase/5'-nucleotidase n=1 Tax=Halobacterium litoreum TaxID=2039234 RepID=A0ABD5NCH0_9EURY|nr:5'-nucleotidase C-terminal domain-containing protein [Halobacterium litoreum]UHH14151.1 5'-nucleotidase C-terminal domain-containing protein [Halobacterium litoreum]